VESGLVESGLVNRKEGGSVLVTEPNAVPLVINHPCRFLWWPDGVSGQPMGIFGGVNDRGIAQVTGGGHDGSLGHELGRRLLGQRGVWNPATAAHGAAAVVTVVHDAAVAEASPATMLDSLHQLWGQVLH